MTAAPDTETRVIVDLMLALHELLDYCYQAQKAGSQCLSIATVHRIASGAVLHAQERARPTPADPVSASELSRRIAGEMARRSAVRGTS